MKCISEFNIMNANTPKIYMSYGLMQQIQHIVAIAPKEAQWFHLVEKDKDGDFVVSEMFIPEQNCSTVEVDTDSNMMVNFWNELKEKHGIQEASNKFSKMFVWCHSHHNMGVSPSAQDVSQFNQMVQTNTSQQNKTPVIMLIFNKKDDYYCRAWDPETNFIYEGLDIEYLTANCSWIDEQAKVKFKEPAKVTNTFNFSKSSGLTSSSSATKVIQRNPYMTSYSYQNDYSSLWGDTLESTFKVEDRSESEIVLDEIFSGSYYSNLKVIDDFQINAFIQGIEEILPDQQRLILYQMLRKDKDIFKERKKEVPEKLFVTQLKRFFKTKVKPTFGTCLELLNYMNEIYEAQKLENEKLVNELLEEFHLEQKIVSVTK